jgi:hypothetical protein
MLDFVTSTQPSRLAIALMIIKATVILKFNQQQDGDRISAVKIIAPSTVKAIAVLKLT